MIFFILQHSENSFFFLNVLRLVNCQKASKFTVGIHIWYMYYVTVYYRGIVKIVQG